MIVQGLSKIHKRKKVLDSINWQVGTGVFSLVGPTNAGKSVMLKILSGNMLPSSGDVCIDDISLSLHPDEYRQKVGYLPQDFTLEKNWSILELMVYTAIFKGLKKDRNLNVQAILEKVELWDFRHRKIKSLPIGMQKRLGIAQALLNEPELLLLDEPVTGLSPLERAGLIKLICHYGKTHTVIFSSQNALDIIQCSKKVTIINSGRFIYSGSLKEIVQMAQNSKSRPNIAHMEKTNDDTLTLAFMDGYRQIVGGFIK